VFRTSSVAMMRRLIPMPPTSGLRIVHTRTDYPNPIIFWCGGRMARVLDVAARAGFHGSSSGQLTKPSDREARG
jgi:hypothetical protein